MNTVRQSPLNKSLPPPIKREGMKMPHPIEHRKALNKIHNKRQGDEYREWMASATDEQKALWERERKIHNKPQHRDEYMRIMNELQSFLPTSTSRQGGKYGRPVNIDRDGDLEGMRVHLRRF